ncbi:DUF2799 domain-containing protein [Acinetobacter pittii]|uniref:DUF2799 domain-containing protein n=2 Tax=Acinetobacter pittii TaxID=48296 RepID=UPI0039BC57E8
MPLRSRIKPKGNISAINECSVICGPIGCAVDFVCRLLHLKIISLKKPLQIGLCNKADQKSYERGYKEGLGYYCQPSNIFYNALEGNGNINVCPVEQRNRLRPYYRAASDYYNAKNEYDRYDEKFKQYSDNAYNEKLKPEERERYRKLLRELQIDRDRINRNYWNSIRDIERFKYDHGLK